MHSKTQLPLLFLALLSLLLTPSSSQTICRALVLEGGPNKGAYQAGAIAGLVSSLSPEESAYDIVTGISMGAVNAAWFSQFPKGQEQDMADQLVDFWLKLKPSDVYKPWPGGVVQGAFFESSFYDTKPGMEYLKSHLTNTSQRYISVGAVNVNNGMFKSFNNFDEEMEADQLVESVMASVAVPGLFPPIEIGDELYFDGAAVKSVDIASAVHQCRKINGGNDSNIVIDIVLSSHKIFNLPKRERFDALQVLLRTVELTSYNTGCIGLIRAQQVFPDVNFRYVVKPKKEFAIPRLPMDFNHRDIKKLVEDGKKDAKDVVSQGEGVSYYEAVREAQKKMGSSGAPSGKAFMKRYLVEMGEIMRNGKRKIDEVAQ